MSENIDSLTFPAHGRSESARTRHSCGLEAGGESGIRKHAETANKRLLGVQTAILGDVSTCKTKPRISADFRRIKELIPLEEAVSRDFYRAHGGQTTWVYFFPTFKQFRIAGDVYVLGHVSDVLDDLRPIRRRKRNP